MAEENHRDKTEQTRFFIDLLRQRGFTSVEVPVIQSADVILDAAGEKARRELFFVDSQNDAQNALRYDLTLPICMKYIAGRPQFDQNGINHKFCAAGTVFRRRPYGDLRESEFEQVSFEYIGFQTRIQTDADCMAAAVGLLKETGLKDPEIQIADIALSGAVIDALGIPPIKAGRLKSALRHREKFMRVLNAEKKKTGAALAGIGALSPEAAGALVSDILRLTALSGGGARTEEEITARFLKKAEEENEEPLHAEYISALAAFYDLTVEAGAVTEKIRTLLRPFTVSVDDFLQYYERRLDYLRASGTDLSNVTYGSLIKRKPEYYSGFMFSLDHPSRKSQSALGGGGRYDTLTRRLSGGASIPSIGCELRPAEIFACIHNL